MGAFTSGPTFYSVSLASGGTGVGGGGKMHGTGFTTGFVTRIGAIR